MRFDVLGPLQVTGSRGPIAISRPRERAILAVLLVRPGEVVSLDRLVNALWSDEKPSAAIASLHAYVSKLRQRLSPGEPARSPKQVLQSVAPGYRLAIGPDDVDALRFQRLAATGREALVAGRPADAWADLDEALGLWRGGAFGDFSYEEFAQVPIRRLDELRAAVVDDRLDALLALGRCDEAVAEIEALLVEEPLRERRWAQLMLGLYRVGRQADALAAFRRAQRALDDVGVVPGAELRELERRVLTQSRDLDVTPVPLPRTAPAVEPPRRPDELVGRAAELAVLGEKWALARAGRGQLVEIVGSPGVGKSALARHVLAAAADAGARTATGRAPDATATPLLWPWLRLVRQLAGGDLPDTVATAVEEVESGARSSLTRAFSAVLGSLRAAARESPLALVLDDMQWADEASVQLLHLAADDVRDLSMLLVVTRREGKSTREATTVALGGLDSDGVGQLVMRMAGEAVEPAVAEAVYTRTAGNPLFAVELSRLLVAEGRLTAAAVRAAPLPPTVREVVQQRLDRLPEQLRAVLLVASVVGREVDLAVVRQLSGLDEGALLDLFELAVASGLFEERPDAPGRYRFAHDLLREGVLAGASGLRRARLHSDAVRLIEGSSDPRVPAVAHTLAEHAVGAIPVDGERPAVYWLIESARLAFRSLAFELASRQFGAAAEVATRLPAGGEANALRARILGWLAQTGFHCGEQRATILATFAQALRLSPPDDIGVRTEVLKGMASYAPLVGDLTVAFDVGRELLALAGDDLWLELEGHYLLAWQLWTGDLDAAAEHSDRAVALIDEVSGRPPAAMRAGFPLPVVRGYHALVRALTGHAADSRAAGERAMEEAAASGVSWTVCWTATPVALAAVVRADSDAVLDVVRAVESADASLDYTDGVIDGCAAWARGNRPALAAARQRLIAAGDGLHHPTLLAMEAQLADRAGDEDAPALAADATTFAAGRGLRLLVSTRAATGGPSSSSR